MMAFRKKEILKQTNNKIVIKLFDSSVKPFVLRLQRQKIKLALLVQPAIIMAPFGINFCLDGGINIA